MEKQKFKVGDRVRFKSWARMAKEYGIDRDNCISFPNNNSFVSGMKHLCGTYATISGITNQHGDDRIFLRNFTTNGDTRWSYSPEMLVRARTRKKKELPLGLEYEADDEQKEKPKANGKFTIGDRVRAIKPVGGDDVVNVLGTICEATENGLYYTVEFDEPFDGWGKFGDHGQFWNCGIDEIEPAGPQKKKRGRPVGSKNKKKVELNTYNWSSLPEKGSARKYMPKPEFKDFETAPTDDKIVSLLEDIKGLLEKLVEQKQPTFVELLKDFLKK